MLAFEKKEVNKLSSILVKFTMALEQIQGQRMPQ